MLSIVPLAPARSLDSRVPTRRKHARRSSSCPWRKSCTLVNSCSCNDEGTGIDADDVFISTTQHAPMVETWACVRQRLLLIDTFLLVFSLCTMRKPLLRFGNMKELRKSLNSQKMSAFPFRQRFYASHGSIRRAHHSTASSGRSHRPEHSTVRTKEGSTVCCASVRHRRY